MFEMSWGKGLRRLWIVGTAIWIVGFVTFGDQYFEGRFVGPVANAVQVTELYAEYWYYHILRSDLVAKKRRLLSDFYDPQSPHYCVSHEQRERERASLAELEREEAKRPPKPPGEWSLTDLERLGMRIPECAAEVGKARSELQDVIDWDEIPDWARDALLSLAYWLLVPPIAALVVGRSLIWALRGFRASR
jgi:hypothetical protein